MSIANHRGHMCRIELHLTDHGRARLDQFVFFSSPEAQPLVTTCSGSASYCVGTSRNFFTWTVGVRAITLLLLKAAQGKSTTVGISGDSGSAAASLDYALSKEPSWLIDFFGMTSKGNAFAKSLFGRRNSERKRPGPVEVYVNDRAIKHDDIKVFVNGTEASSKVLQEVTASVEAQFTSPEPSVVPRPISLTKPKVDERESSPLFVRSRLVSQHFDIHSHCLHFTLTSCFENISNEPVPFLHISVVNQNGTLPPDFLVKSPEDPELTWQIVHSSDAQTRMLVEFSTPIPPGTNRTVTFSYNIPDFLDTESRIDHSLRVPCGDLTIEMSCSSSYRFHRYGIQAERDDDLLFGSLPPACIKKDSTGQNTVLTWSMKNPPHGYRYRLLWAIEPQKSKPTQSSPRPQQPPLHEPPVLLT